MNCDSENRPRINTFRGLTVVINNYQNLSTDVGKRFTMPPFAVYNALIPGQ